jgi:hypothetical protein
MKERTPSLGEQLLYPTCCLIGVVTVMLKLAGVIEWSWISVLAPFWIIPLIVFLIVGFFLLCAVAIDYL